MRVRLRLQKPTRADWYAPAELTGELAAVVICTAMLGLRVIEWRAAVGVACVTAGVYQLRIAISEYRRRRTRA